MMEMNVLLDLWRSLADFGMASAAEPDPVQGDRPGMLQTRDRGLRRWPVVNGTLETDSDDMSDGPAGGCGQAGFAA